MRIHVRFFTATLVAAMALLGVLLSARTATAQCSQITVVNNISRPVGFSGTVNLILIDGSTPPTTVTQSCPGLGATTVITLPGTFSLRGVQGATGVNHYFPSQPPRPACLPLPNGDPACIALPATTPPPSVYCASVCYNDQTCTITLVSCQIASECIP
ncbi:MAG TPA: hypothetical protein VHI13_22015 [Candidatus Kapabacteria bacterium]|nr:hypothetical protein [Candidatus Kapabacteria bacterium]